MAQPTRTSRHRLATFLLLGVTLVSVSACGGTDDVARSIGLTRDVPDEFTVTTRAPLSMPPDFSLPRPTPGAQRPQERSARSAAEAALSPQTALASGNAAISPGQQALLNAAGPAAPATIRSDVDKDAALATGDRRLTDRLMFWKSPDAQGTVVDPQREAKRLRENAALGQSADNGDTAIIQRKPQSLFDRLF